MRIVTVAGWSGGDPAATPFASFGGAVSSAPMQDSGSVDAAFQFVAAKLRAEAARGLIHAIGDEELETALGAASCAARCG